MRVQVLARLVYVEQITLENFVKILAGSVRRWEVTE